MSKPKITLDTNTAIAIINGKQLHSGVQKLLDNADVYISVITRIELYAKAGLTQEETDKIDELLSIVFVIPLAEPIVDATIAIRQSNPNIKLPDAIIAATAVALKALLLTEDSRLLKLSFPGFSAQTVS
jgi:predicted nucleic acid-binding protein